MENLKLIYETCFLGIGALRSWR